MTTTALAGTDIANKIAEIEDLCREQSQRCKRSDMNNNQNAAPETRPFPASLRPQNGGVTRSAWPLRTENTEGVCPRIRREQKDYIIYLLLLILMLYSDWAQRGSVPCLDLYY